jgi:uncharacterized protein YndB with AHSA1/START domain
MMGSFAKRSGDAMPLLVPNQKRIRAALAALLTLACGSAGAAVVTSSDAGFEILETATIAAPPKDVYDGFVRVGRWWNSEHTFSGDASNLTLEARASGCFCERLRNGGSVMHLLVVRAVPGEALVMTGALGPFQTLAVSGTMTMSIAAAGTGSELTLRYRLGGYTADGLQKRASAVDQMLGEQVARFKRYVETGDPAPR